MKFKSIFGLVITVLLMGTNLSGQNYTTQKSLKGKWQKQFAKADEAAGREQFEEALALLNDILAEVPDFADGYYLRAGVQFEMGQREQAELDFEKLLVIAPDYNIRAIYRLARTELVLAKYEEAVAHFRQYLAANPKSGVREAIAEKLLADALFAAEAVKHPVPFEPDNLGPNINTTGQEYLPAFTADGEYLVYTTRINGQEDFYYSRKVKGEWQLGQPLEQLNTPMNEGAQSISADGRLLIFTACAGGGDVGGCDLYYSEYKGSGWTRPEKIPGEVNSKYWESQPALSADGKTLFFASDRPGGLGRRDIWMSKLQTNGQWGPPTNLGDSINTPDHDQCPFLHSDGQTLYFCSDGWPGMGGNDLYFSRRTPDGKWGKPTNLGYPINTTANEGTLVVSLDGKTAYFATDKNTLSTRVTGKEAPKTVNNDIYSFPLYEAARPLPVTYVKAKVFDSRTKEQLEAQVEFFDLTTGQLHAIVATNSAGEFLVTLPKGRDYALNVSKKGYLFFSENFALAANNTLDKPYLLNIGLEQITKPSAENKASQPIILHNVFFESGSAQLLNSSQNELEKLYQLLQSQSKLSIQINGHTDNVGSEADNLRLSEDRAKAVYQWLIDKGVAAERLQFKGFGESQPIDSNDTEEGRQKNRRTEFVVL
ncbi:MAG: OmpA family protein [Saprospiraceae bacterium]